MTLEKLEEAKEALENVESSLAVLRDGVRGKKIACFLVEDTKPMAIYHQAVDAACEMVKVAAMLLKYEMSQADADGQAGSEGKDYGDLCS